MVTSCPRLGSAEYTRRSCGSQSQPHESESQAEGYEEEGASARSAYGAPVKAIARKASPSLVRNGPAAKQKTPSCRPGSYRVSPGFTGVGTGARGVRVDACTGSISKPSSERVPRRSRVGS